MGTTGDAITYTFIAVGFAVLIFLGALFFVQVSRRGNRRFKWWRGRDGEQRRDSGASSRAP